MSEARGREAAAAFEAYLGVRSRLPAAGFGTAWQSAESLAEIAGPFDLVLLDAYGVLNVGDSPIPGAAEAIAALRAAGKSVAVVSNSAAYPKRVMMQRYARLGFDFAPEEVVTSREALLAHLARAPRLRRQRLAYATDGFVPPLMAPFVVVTLEVIYIDHCKGNGLMLALRPFGQLVAQAGQRAPIRHQRHGVGFRHHAIPLLLQPGPARVIFLPVEADKQSG